MLGLLFTAKDRRGRQAINPGKGEAMARKWRIHLVTGSHFDYGWAASPGECFAYLTEVIRTAVDDITGEYPGYKFTVEYVLFMQHFFETYPEYLPRVKRLLRDGRLDIGSIMSGAIEQWLDGEMLIHQLVRAKRWVRETLDYDPVTAQHSDLPGHIIQIAQFLQGAGIKHLAYSRYHPPSPLHRWRSPDGSEVIACCHFHETYDHPSDWSGYGWGRTLFVENQEDYVYQTLPVALDERDRFWPKGVPDLLMGCQGDLQPPDPIVLERVRRWNERYPDAPIRISTISEFFHAIDPAQIPCYQGEAPYAFFALPSVYVPCAQAMRRGENALAAAEKWSVFAAGSGLGRAPRARISRARDALFLPHDHNTAGRRGEINDAERLKDALQCRLEAESVFQEKAMAFTVNIRYGALPEGVYPITVFNSLSWDRTDAVETYIEIPMRGVRALHIADSRGIPVPSQITATDEAGNSSRVSFVFVAEKVPAHGYETFYIRPSSRPEKAESSLDASPDALINQFFDIRIEDHRITTIHWRPGTPITQVISRKSPASRLAAPVRTLNRPATRSFNEIYMLEDKMTNVEAGPWEVSETYTGREWDASIRKVEVIERGPVRAVLRFHGTIRSTRFTQDVILYDKLERIGLRHTLDYKMKMHTMTRVAYPLDVPGGEATYESPYGTVRLEKDEMPNTFRGQGERWVQKWIDISNDAFGVTLATRQVSHAIQHNAIEPILLRTAINCGTPFYYYGQNETFTFDFALYPHGNHWKKAAAHRFGWEFNNPLDSCNWTPCFPIKPLRRTRNLPERDSFLQADRDNVVVTAIAPSVSDPGAFIIRLVEFHGRRNRVTLACKWPVAEAVEVNFLEEPIGELSFSANKIRINPRKYGIHTIKLKFARRE